MKEKKLSIYIHVPFCISKCSYCDFYSLSGEDIYFDNYFKALEKEIILTAENILKARHNIKIESVFFGGGTPSYVPGKYIAGILNIIRKFFILEKDCEITVECNPGSLDYIKLNIYKDAGVNRISLGLQSTNDKVLKSIGRSHSYSDFLESIKMLKLSGFTNINTDLMFGLPGQTLNILEESILNVVDLGIRHVSFYSLTLEKGTKLEMIYSKSPELFPDEDLERQMYHNGISLLKKNGFIHYEISNFANRGYACKHNLLCWNLHEYLGFGCAAHSFYEGKRYSNFPDVNRYISLINSCKNEIPRDEYIILSDMDIANEYFMLGLRLIDGVSTKKFQEKFNIDINIFLKKLEKLVDMNLIEKSGNTFKMTKYGIDYANRIFVEFI